MVTAIVAYNKNFIIGTADNQIPWHLKEDLKFFKEQTMGCPVIMGRKTWESIPQKFRPLPGRYNLVVTRTPSTFCEDKVGVVTSVENAIRVAEGYYPDKEIFITGGGQIYKEAIEKGLVNRVLASEVHGFDDVQGAVYFPNLRELGWTSKVFREYDAFEVVEYAKHS